MIIDEAKFVKVTSGVPPSQIQIFSASGDKIASSVFREIFIAVVVPTRLDSQEN